MRRTTRKHQEHKNKQFKEEDKENKEQELLVFLCDAKGMIHIKKGPKGNSDREEKGESETRRHLNRVLLWPFFLLGMLMEIFMKSESWKTSERSACFHAPG